MFKFITLSCLLAAVSVQSKVAPNQAVPYYPQPYPAPYPYAYPQFYSAQPKYGVQPAAYVAAASYPGYRQVFVPASPVYNPYYHGYSPYPAYPQAQQYPYAGVQNDGPDQQASTGSWTEYINNIWNYVPNFPYGSAAGVTPAGGASEGPIEGPGPAGVNSETPSETAGPGKGGDKPVAEAPKSDMASNEQPSQSPSKQFAAYPLPYFAQPQFYGPASYRPIVYDPSKLNGANNGAVSSFLFPKNIQSEFQQPQPFADQKYYQVQQANQGTAAQAYQRYLQFQKQQLQGQYQQGQYQHQQQDQPFQQQQPEPFQQQPQESFQQQYNQQPQKDESSVVVDSNVTGLQVNAEGQQQPQSKVATGPTVAVAQPQGTAFAGIGGRAESEPISTAIVGQNSTAISEPSATAISLDLTPTINLTPVQKYTTAYVAKYAPELGVYRVAEIKSL